MCPAKAVLPAAPGAARTSTATLGFCRAARWQAGWPRPGGHWVLSRELLVIAAPLPRPVKPPLRDARPVTRNCAW
jgi:hypothetical protein